MHDLTVQSHCVEVEENPDLEPRFSQSDTLTQNFGSSVATIPTTAMIIHYSSGSDSPLLAKVMALS